MPRLGAMRLWMRDFYQKKLRQTYRILRKTLDFASLVLGTALAALFPERAKLADIGLAFGRS